MKLFSKPRGFTRLELLVLLALGVLACLFLYGISQSGKRQYPNIREKTVASTAKNIHTMLTEWAKDNNGEFPTANQYSNEAFRELFKARLMDDEKPFSIQGDPWHKNSPSGDGKGPDNDIGSAPEYAQALMPGECAFAYVSGLTEKSDPQLPLLANAFSETRGVYTDNKLQKGGIFKGKVCAWVTVGGNGKVSELSADFRVLQNKGEQKIDVFSEAWGTKPADIKNPEG